MANVIDRLKAQLLASGIQQKNQALFQVINQLIDNVSKSVNDLEAFIGGGSSSILNQSFITVNDDKATLPLSRRLIAGSGIGFNDQGNNLVISSVVPFGLDGEDGIDGVDGMPGIQGIQGIPGIQGVPGIDGEDGEDGLPGIQGIQGLQGPIGPIGVPWINNEEYEETPYFPIGNHNISDGQWYDVPYNASDFSASTGTWTVDSADVIEFFFTIIKDVMIVYFNIANSDVSATPLALLIRIPLGFTAAARSSVNGIASDAGAVTEFTNVRVVAGGSTIQNTLGDGTAWATTAADNTSLSGTIIIRINR